jgi:CheY-like chemotaxis protein
MSDRLHILIVDDNPANANTLADILEVKGYAVHAVYSGAEALKVLEALPIDILLTDVKMPDMDGVELYKETMKSHPNVYTIFMTAYAADDLIKNGMSLGVKTVLTKPVDINLLLLMFASIEETQYPSYERAAGSGKNVAPRNIRG